MDKMSVFAMLTTSLPETVFNIYVTFLILGIWLPEIRGLLPFKDFAQNRKSNIVRFFVAVVMLSFVCIASRWFIDNMIIMIAIETILGIIALKYVYKIEFWKSTIAMLIYAVFLIVVESIFIPPTLKVLGITQTDLYNANDTLRVILSLVDRVFQTAAILLLWNWQVMTLNMSQSKGAFKWVMPSMVGFVISELFLYYIILNSIPSLNMYMVVLGGAGCLILLLSNVLMVKAITIILKNERRM